MGGEGKVEGRRKGVGHQTPKNGNLYSTLLKTTFSTPVRTKKCRTGQQISLQLFSHIIHRKGEHFPCASEVMILRLYKNMTRPIIIRSIILGYQAYVLKYRKTAAIQSAKNIDLIFQIFLHLTIQFVPFYSELVIDIH